MTQIKIFLTVLMTALLLSVPATANAVEDGECRRVGTSNMFAEANEPIDIDLGVLNTFPEYRCNVDHIRLYKAYANTRTEVRELLAFSQGNDKTKYKMAFCRTSKTKAHILDFAYFYYYHMKTIRRAEREGYVSYLNAYADRRNCRIY